MPSPAAREIRAVSVGTCALRIEQSSLPSPALLPDCCIGQAASVWSPGQVHVVTVAAKATGRGSDAAASAIDET